jgi:hypothetical protein
MKSLLFSCCFFVFGLSASAQKKLSLPFWVIGKKRCFIYTNSKKKKVYFSLSDADSLSLEFKGGHQEHNLL